jgi:hypothetical protein
VNCSEQFGLRSGSKIPLMKRILSGVLRRKKGACGGKVVPEQCG